MVILIGKTNAQLYLLKKSASFRPDLPSASSQESELQMSIDKKYAGKTPR